MCKRMPEVVTKTQTPEAAVQEFVNNMGESLNHMKLTPTQREFAKAVLRSGIQYHTEKKLAGINARLVEINKAAGAVA